MKDGTDNYLSFDNKFMKCTRIYSVAGSRKTQTIEYRLIYGLSQGLNIITISIMGRRAIQLGSRYLAYLLSIPVSKGNIRL